MITFITNHASRGIFRRVALASTSLLKGKRSVAAGRKKALEPEQQQVGQIRALVGISPVHFPPQMQNVLLAGEADTALKVMHARTTPVGNVV